MFATGEECLAHLLLDTFLGKEVLCPAWRQGPHRAVCSGGPQRWCRCRPTKQSEAPFLLPFRSARCFAAWLRAHCAFPPCWNSVPASPEPPSCMPWALPELFPPNPTPPPFHPCPGLPAQPSSLPRQPWNAVSRLLRCLAPSDTLPPSFQTFALLLGGGMGYRGPAASFSALLLLGLFSSGGWPPHVLCLSRPECLSA